MQKACVWIAVLAACGHDNNAGSPDAAPHGDTGPAIDAPVPPGPNLVTFTLYGDPDLIVYRDGHGPWLVPTAAAQDGDYELHVTDDYQVVVVCSSSGLTGNIDAEQRNATFGDGDAPYMFCTSGDGTSSPPSVAITGQMLQAGRVTMGDTDQGTTAPWTFNLAVTTGTHDLIAVGPTKMLIRRDLAVTAATTVPAVDVDTAGSPTTISTLAVTGAAAGDTVTTMVDLFTGNEFATLSSTTNNSATFPPASLVLNTDFVELAVRAENAAHTQFRSTYAYGAPLPSSLALMPVLTGASFTATTPIAVQWGTLPAYDTVTFEAFGGTSNSFIIHAVTATNAWLAKAGASSLAFETAAKGFDPAWAIDPAQAYAFFEVTHNGATSSSNTGIENSVEAAFHVARVQSAAHRARLAASCNRTTSICKQRVLRARAQR